MSDRHSFRAEWHDYNSGIYFVTICANHKRHIFGKISDGQIYLSAIGNIIKNCLISIPNHHKNVELWNYVVMPNHIHMVLCVGTTPVGAQYFAPATTTPATTTPATTTPEQNTGCLKPPRHGDPRIDNHFNSRLAVIIRSFKAACSIEVNRQLRALPSSLRAQNIGSLPLGSLPLSLRAQNIGDIPTGSIPSSSRAQNIAPLPAIGGIWQRNYHEHIIRDQRAFENIMNYIDTNIEKWNQDCFYTN